MGNVIIALKQPSLKELRSGIKNGVQLTIANSDEENLKVNSYTIIWQHCINQY